MVCRTSDKIINQHSSLIINALLSFLGVRDRRGKSTLMSDCC